MIEIYFIISVLIIVAILFSKSKLLTSILAGSFISFQIALTIYAWAHRGLTADYFSFDELGLLFMSVMALLSCTTFYHGLNYLKNEPEKNYNLYHAGFIGLMTSITGVYLSNNITLTWIFLEATTLSVAALIYHNRTIRTLEATWKYVFVCSIGIALAYLGILFLSMTVYGIGNTGMSYVKIAEIVQNANPLYLKLAFLFIIIGYSAKLEIFPLYTIGIDANYVAPAPASAFISTALVNAGFVALYRVYKVMMHTSVAHWISSVMIIAGIFSLLVAAIYMQRVKNFKRLLAYSTVENMGLAIIGLGIGGAGIYAAIFLVFMHAFVKSSMFYQFGQAHKILMTYKIFKTGDYLRLFPVGALVLLLGLIVLSAIPPSGLFISEFMIFYTSIKTGNWWIFIVVAILLCFVIYGMASKILQLIFSPLDYEITNPVKISPWQTVTQYVMIGFVIYLCFSQPKIITDLISKAALM